MKTKTIKINLNPAMTWSPDHQRIDYFKIAKLTNAVSIKIGEKTFGLLDALTPAEAEELNKREDVEITVTSGS